MDTTTAVWWAVQAGARLGLAARRWHLDQLAGQAVTIPAPGLAVIGITSVIDFSEGDEQGVLAIGAGLRELHRLALLGELVEDEEDARWVSYRRAFSQTYAAMAGAPMDVAPEARHVLATLRSRPARWGSHVTLAAEVLQLLAERLERTDDPREHQGWVHLSASVARAVADVMDRSDGAAGAQAITVAKSLLTAAGTVMASGDDWLMQVEDDTLRSLPRDQVAQRLASLRDGETTIPRQTWALDV